MTLLTGTLLTRGRRTVAAALRATEDTGAFRYGSNYTPKYRA